VDRGTADSCRSLSSAILIHPNTRSMLLRRLCSAAAHPASFRLPPTIKQLLSASGSESSATSVTGWIKSIRKQKNITFAVVSDGTTPEGLQAVVLKQQGTAPEILKRLACYTQLEPGALTNIKAYERHSSAAHGKSNPVPRPRPRMGTCRTRG
jgi:hypothetical protein